MPSLASSGCLFSPPSLSGGSGTGQGLAVGALNRAFWEGGPHFEPIPVRSPWQPSYSLATILRIAWQALKSPWHPLHRELVKNHLHPKTPVIPDRVTPGMSPSKTVCNVFTEVMISPFPYLTCILQEQLKIWLLNPLADKLLWNCRRDIHEWASERYEERKMHKNSHNICQNVPKPVEIQDRK